MTIRNLLEDYNDLSNEFKEKVETLFDAAVKERVTEIEEAKQLEIAALEEHYQTQIDEMSKKYDRLVEEYIDQEIVPAVDRYIEEEVLPAIDGFLNKVVNDWVEDNRVAIESGIKAELSESFLREMHRVFVNHFVQVPPTKVDAFEKVSAELEKTRIKLDEALKKQIEQQQLIEQYQKDQIVAEAMAGLTIDEQNRMQRLVDDLFDGDFDKFKSKVETIRESIIRERRDETENKYRGVISEDIENVDHTIEDDIDDVDPQVARYAEFLTRYSKLR